MIKLDYSDAVARITENLDAKEKEAYKIFKYYAAEIMQYFMHVQGSAPAETKGAFWTNHTFKAVEGFIAYAFTTPNAVNGRNIGLTLKNKTWYAVYLEHGHGGKFASFPTLLEVFYPQIEADLKILYGDT